jgi:anti-sigma factor RsiW
MTDHSRPTTSAAHPVTYDDLIAFAAGDPGLSSASNILAHLASCPACAATVARYRLVRQAIVTDARLAPSANALARVRNLAAGLRQPERNRTTPLASLRRIVARLTFDGASQPALHGLRGGTESYLLAYTANGIEVDVEVSPDPTSGRSRWHLMGQIAGSTDHAGAEVGLAAPGEADPVVRAETDDEGIFSLQAGPGRYDLLLWLPEGLVVLPDVNLGEQG